MMNKAQAAAFERFKRASTSAVPRIIWDIAGEYGTGKTHFCLSAPGPMVIMSFDKGLEGVVEKFQEQKPIYISEYDWEPTDDTFEQSDAIKLRDQVIADYYQACSVARTVIWDKETDFWNLVRYAEFGGPSERPSNYDALNQRMRKYVNHAKKLTINMGFVQSLKDEWVSITDKSNGKEKGRSTGARKKAGFKELDGLVNVVLFNYVENGSFMTLCEKARGIGSADAQGKVFSSAEGFDFPTLGMTLCPDSEASDWH